MRYVSHLIQHFRLHQWTVLVSSYPTDKDEDQDHAPTASIDSHTDRYCAILRVSPNWMKYTEEVKRDTLVHEMLHLITRDLRLRIEAFRGLLYRRTPSVALMAGMDIDSAEERMVDHLASTLSPHLPQYPGPLAAPIPTVRREKDWS